MAKQKVLILGPSGSGKSSAIETLDEKTTFLIMPDSKGLPFGGWRKRYKTSYKPDGKIDLSTTNMVETKDPSTILTLLRVISDTKPEIKVIVIDTLTLMMDHSYMERIKEKGYEKYGDLALEVYKILSHLDSLRNDITVIVTAHVQNDYDSTGELRTSFKVIGGKLIGEKIEVEGMFNTVLYSEVVMEEGTPKYYFRTQNNGKNTCKSPKGLFDTLLIPNDFNYVLEKINTFEN